MYRNGIGGGHSSSRAPVGADAIDDGLGEWCRGDLCVGFFKEMWYAGRIPIPFGARILEIGAAEVDWSAPFKARRPDVQITALDQRFVERPAADVWLQKDLLVAGPELFPRQSFDVVVAISVIEHVGIGRYGDHVDPDGDITVMQYLKRWLRPDGVMYLDVPYRPDGPSTPFRAYNEADLQQRVIQDWRVIDRQFFTSTHPDGPYIALVLRP
jgi:SAM-dependent methyltransferase